MKNFIMSFSIAIFLMMISITNVSAMKFYTEDFNEYDLPNPDSVGTSRPNWFIAVNNDNTIYLYKSSSDFYVSGIGYASSVKFYYYKLVNNEWTYSSSNYVNVGYNVRYGSMKYVFTNNGIYSSSSKTDYAIAPGTGLTSYKSIKINYHGQACSKEENAIIDLIGIDFTDYIFDDNIYIYQISYDNENWNTIDISEVFNKSNYEYDLKIFYNTTIYARVLNNQGDLVSSASYVVDDLSPLDGFYTYIVPKGYKYVFISSDSVLSSFGFLSKDYLKFMIGFYDPISNSDSTSVSYSDHIDGNYRFYDFDLTNYPKNIVKLERTSYEKEELVLFIPNGSYVSFALENKDSNGNYSIDYTYRDEDGNIINSSQTIIKSKSDTFFSFVRGSFDSFIDSFSYISSTFNDFIINVDSHISYLFYFIFGLFVLLVIIKIIL